MDKVTLRQVYRRVFWSTPVSIILPLLHSHHLYLNIAHNRMGSAFGISGVTGQKSTYCLRCANGKRFEILIQVRDFI